MNQAEILDPDEQVSIGLQGAVNTAKEYISSLEDKPMTTISERKAELDIWMLKRFIKNAFGDNALDKLKSLNDEASNLLQNRVGEP